MAKCAILFFMLLSRYGKRVEEVRKQQVIEARENFRNRYAGEDRNAREKSIISRDIIVSQTGKKYYHGVECNNDCLTLKANYDKDESEDELALDESFGKIAVSETGKKYYRGVECEGDCLGYKTGYRWANELGVTSEAFCDEKSETEAFRAGCLDGVENVILDLRAYIQAEYPEDCEKMLEKLNP